MIHTKSYSVADLYGSSCENFSIFSMEDEKSTCLNPNNTKTRIISKIAKGALALCGLFWTAMAGLSIEHLLAGSSLLIAGATTPWGIAILSFVGLLTISAYITYALTSENGTC